MNDQMIKMEESHTHAIEQIEGIFKENEASEEAGSLNLKKQRAIASPRSQMQPGQRRKKRKAQK